MPRTIALLLLLAAGTVPLAAHTPLRYRRLATVRPQGEQYRPGQVVVLFKRGTDQRSVERAIRDGRGAVARRSARSPERYLVGLEAGVEVMDAVASFRSMPEVDVAGPNHVMHALFTPDDEFYDVQWNFKLIGVERMWDIQKGDPSVVVAVLDTGIAYEDFGPFRKAPDWEDTRFVEGLSTFDGSSHANDDNGHGTHVASTIAEGTNNDLGVAGLAFQCGLMPVKVLDRDGYGDEFGLSEGIDFAVANKDVKVINLSLGFGPSVDDIPSVSRALDRAFAAGITVVAAAGNESVGTVDYPASYSKVIAVGATDGRHPPHLAPYSSFGSKLSVVAPGGDFDRDDDDNGDVDGILQQTFAIGSAEAGRYDEFDLIYYEGTSQASAHVSALAALLVRQGITDPAAVKAAIESTALDLGDPGRDDTFGHGLIQPAAALSGLGFGR